MVDRRGGNVTAEEVYTALHQRFYAVVIVANLGCRVLLFSSVDGLLEHQELLAEKIF
jgi:hypothetical protein